MKKAKLKRSSVLSKFWWVYIIRCCDKKLYTGITNNLERRIREHRSGNGCRFTRCRTPIKLLYNEICPDRPLALKREACIKAFPREKKLALIKKSHKQNIRVKK